MRELHWSDIPSLWPRGGNGCVWCLGSGPSLDAAGLDRLEGQPVLACNAAAVYAFSARCAPSSWWVVNNVNAIEQSAALVPPPWRVICLERCRAALAPYEDKIETLVTYTREEHFPRHTTAETMLRIAHVARFTRAFLVGVDCDPHATEVYAARARHANCIYEESGKREIYMRNFTRAIEDLAAEVATDIEIVSTSPSFSRSVLRFVPFDCAVDIYVEADR